MKAIAATFWIISTGTNFAPIVPIIIATKVARAKPKIAEIKMVRGVFSFEERAIIASWVLSPNSARNIRVKVEANIFQSTLLLYQNESE